MKILCSRGWSGGAEKNGASVMLLMELNTQRLQGFCGMTIQWVEPWSVVYDFLMINTDSEWSPMIDCSCFAVRSSRIWCSSINKMINKARGSLITTNPHPLYFCWTSVITPLCVHWGALVSWYLTAKNPWDSEYQTVKQLWSARIGSAQLTAASGRTGKRRPNCHSSGSYPSTRGSNPQTGRQQTLERIWGMWCSGDMYKSCKE